MDLVDREHFLENVATGRTALRDVGGLGAGDVDAIARVGAAALQGGRFAQAEQVFVALAALEPDVPAHWLHVAVARQGRGDVDGAVVACASLLHKTASRSGDDDEAQVDRARAFLLRAELCGRSNADQARADLAAARALTSPAARAVVDAALGTSSAAAPKSGVR